MRAQSLQVSLKISSNARGRRPTAGPLRRVGRQQVETEFLPGSRVEAVPLDYLVDGQEFTRFEEYLPLGALPKKNDSTLDFTQVRDGTFPTRNPAKLRRTVDRL